MDVLFMNFDKDSYPLKWIELKDIDK